MARDYQKPLTPSRLSTTFLDTITGIRDRRSKESADQKIAEENKRRFDISQERIDEQNEESLRRFNINEDRLNRAEDIAGEKRAAEFATQEASRFTLDPKRYTSDQLSKEKQGIAESRAGLIESGATKDEIVNFDRMIESQYGSGNKLFKRRQSELGEETFGREGVDATKIQDIRNKIAAEKRAEENLNINKQNAASARALRSEQVAEIRRKKQVALDKKAKEEAELVEKRKLAYDILDLDENKKTTSSVETQESIDGRNKLKEDLIKEKKFREVQEKKVENGDVEKKTSNYNSIYNYLINQHKYKGGKPMSSEDAHNQALTTSGLGKLSDSVVDNSSNISDIQKQIDNYDVKTNEFKSIEKKTAEEIKADKIQSIKDSNIDPLLKLEQINSLNKPLSLDERKHNETIRSNKAKEENNRLKIEALGNAKTGKYKASPLTLKALGLTDVDSSHVGKFMSLKETMKMSDNEFAELIKNADYGIPFYGASTDEAQYENLKKALEGYKIK